MSISSASQSQCTSGCESGWTRYLNESSFSDEKWERFNGGEESFTIKKGGKGRVMEEEGGEGGCDDEDNLSMVSDASSGPPYYEVDEYWNSVNEPCHYSFLGDKLSEQSSKKMKNTAHGKPTRDQHLQFHDTGSNCSSSKCLILQKGNSSARIKDKSQSKKNPDNVHSFSSVWKKQFTGKSGGRKWA